MLPATDHRGVFLGVVRRAAVLRAVAKHTVREPDAELADLALDFVDLYWRTTAGLLVGNPDEEPRD